MCFHRAGGEEQVFGDLAIGLALRGETRDAQLSRCQGVAAADPIATRPRAG
jgi:hypothetical protein